MAEKLEFKNDIDVISVLRTRLLGYTTAPDGTTLLQAGNLTIKEVGDAILQDSGLREQIAQIIGVHADDVERIQEAIETLQGIDTDYGQRVTDLEEGQATLTSSLTDLESDTYRKAEVDAKVADATPSDYEALKRQVREQGYAIENQQALTDGIVKLDHHEQTENGKLDIQSSKFVAPNAMVEEVRGRTVSSKNLLKTDNPITVNGDGSLRQVIRSSYFDVYKPNTAYTLSVDVKPNGVTYSAGGNLVYFTIDYSDGTHDYIGVGTSNYTSGRVSVTTASGKTITYIDMNAHPRFTGGSIELSHFQMEEGTTATPYEPWFEGLRDAEVTGVRSVGRNLAYIERNGQYVDSSYNISSSSDYNVWAFKASPNTDYTLSFKSKAIVNYTPRVVQVTGDSFHDGAELVRVRNADTEYVVQIRTGVSCEYVYFHIASDSTNVQAEEGEVASEYTPHHSSLLPLNITLKQGDVYKPSEGKVHVDRRKKRFSDLTWVKGGNYFSSNEISDALRPSGNWAVLDTMCDNFSVRAYQAVYNHSAEGILAVHSNGQLWVYPSGFSDMSVDDFTRLYGNTEVLYELASPTEETAPSVSPYIRVEGGGTVTVESDGAQAEANIFYQTKYV